MERETIKATLEDRIYCLKVSSDYHSEVCEECRFYPNCDHMTQDDLTELTIKDLETLKQQPKWISVSERLPDEFSVVLCNTDSEEIFIATYLGKMNDGTDCFDDGDGMMWEGDVIAWMLLPQPYKV